MVDLKQLQDEIWSNKTAKGFNTANIEKEFNYTYAELAEAYEAYRKNTGEAGEELADVIIFIMSLAKMLGVEDMEGEIARKMAKNEARTYKRVGGHHIKLTKGEDYE